MAYTRPRIAPLSSARLVAGGVVCEAGEAGRWVAALEPNATNY